MRIQILYGVKSNHCMYSALIAVLDYAVLKIALSISWPLASVFVLLGSDETMHA